MAEISLQSLIAPPFYAVHRDIREERHLEYWLKGGRGSTKSSFASIEIGLGLLRDPEANAIIYRKVAATLRESVFSQMLWAIDKLGVAPYFRAKVSPMEILYAPTGQRILFRGADDPSKSKSIKLQKGYFKYLWIEELPEFASMDDVRTIKASVIRGGGSAMTICSYNPPLSPRNWVNAEALTPPENRLTHHSSYLDVPEEWLGKPFLAEAELLKATNGRAYRHMYLGEVTGTGGSVFENVAARRIADEEIKTFGTCYMGMDFGWYPDPFVWVRCAYLPAQRRLFVFDEYRALKMSNYDVYQHLTDVKGVTPADEVIADSAEQKSIADMRSYGMRCVGAAKGPGSVTASTKWMQGLKEIVIDPVRCPHAAREFLEYEYERTRDGELANAYPDKDNHAIDAVRYALNRVWLAKGM